MRASEGPLLAAFSLWSFLLFASLYAAKALRQSTFIDSLGAASLPWAYLLVALLSYPAVAFHGHVAERLRWHRLVASSSAVLALSFLGFFWLFGMPWVWVPVAFYLWITIAFGLAVSQLWSSANRLLDPRQAKRLFGLIAAGGSLGGIAGGQIARLATAAASTRHTLLVPAALLAVLAVLVSLLRRLRPFGVDAPASSNTEQPAQGRGGFSALRRSRHLQVVAALAVLAVMVGQVVDLQFNWGVEQATAGLGERTAAFGNFYSIVAMAAFLFQLLLTAQIHRLLGMGFALRALPGAMAIGTGALMITAGFFPGALLVAASALKITEGGLRHSVDQVSRELLFVPVPSRMRVQVKAFIDVFVQRFAEGLAAVLLLTVTVGLLAPSQAGWISFGLIAVWLALTVVARRQYVASYRAGLRAGTLDPETTIDLSNATTLEVLFQSLGNPNGRQVIHTLDLLMTHGRSRLVPPFLVYHEDSGVRRRTLEILAAMGRRDAAALVEKCLADPDPDVRAEAVRALAALQGKDARDMMVPRLSSSDPGIRAAAIACLAGGEKGGREVTAALEEMLADADPEVRIEAAKGLGNAAEPAYQEYLVQLLYDREPGVIRAAIMAVRRRAEAAGLSPQYLPVLIALMHHRRLKHDCREALTAFGEDVIPALVHFMNDPGEDVWVRRAIPKTLASVGGATAARALVENLGAEDRFLRSKVVEALGTLRQASVDLGFCAGEIVEEMRVEARGYLENLAAFAGLGLHPGGVLEGPVVCWREGGERPTLLEELLADRMRGYVLRLFGLLALLESPGDVRAAQRGVLSEETRLRSHALEYLDNRLSGEARRWTFSVIDDIPVDERLRLAERIFQIVVQSRTKTLEQLITSSGAGDPDQPALAAAALHSVLVSGAHELYPLVERVRDETRDLLVRETASWVLARVGRPHDQPRATDGRPSE